MAKVARMSSTYCPCCDTELDVEPIHGAPELGMMPINLTACDCCGHLMLVDRNLTLRELTTVEFHAVINHPVVVAERWRWVN
jgi:hypothetical protein